MPPKINFPLIVDDLYELPSGVRRKIKREIAGFIDAVGSGQVVLLSPAERDELISTHINPFYVDWEERQLCRYPGCDKKTIRRSHTIQHKGPIFAISENNHVLAPHYDVWSEAGKMERVGYKKASVFPGFCEKHEGVFKEFEEKKEVVTEVDCVLQIFRTIARELVRISYDVDRLGRLAECYRSLRKERANSAFQYRIRKISKNHPRLKDFDLDVLTTMEVENINDLQVRKNDASAIGSNLINKFARFLRDKQVCDAPIHYRDIDLPIMMPVTASGRVAIHCNQGEEIRRILLFIVVLPQNGGTKLLISCERPYRDLMEQYVRQMNILSDTGDVDVPSVIEFIEKFIVYGTDHWFVKPSFWAGLSESVKSMMLASIPEDTDGMAGHIDYPFLPRV